VTLTPVAGQAGTATITVTVTDGGGRSVKTSFALMVIPTTTTLLSLLLGVPAAYALARARLRPERLLSLWVLATRMAPPIAFGIPVFLIYKHLDLIDTRLGLVIIYLSFNLSLVIWMMRAFFEGLPRSLEEAPTSTGAGGGPSCAWFTVGAGLATTAIFCFLCPGTTSSTRSSSRGENGPPGTRNSNYGKHEDQRGRPDHAARGRLLAGCASTYPRLTGGAVGAEEGQ
jgi:hypothetical protein